METMANWLDVGPFLEGMEEMRDTFARELELDMFKEGLLSSGISMKYVLWGALATADECLLFVPGPEAYALLKEAVVDGPSLVFTRKHEFGKMEIRSHQYVDIKH